MNFGLLLKTGAIVLTSAILFMQVSCSKENNEDIKPSDDADNLGYISDNRDGRTYKTIKIGNQEWMAENLAYLPEVTFEEDWGNESEEQYTVLGYTPGSGNETVEGAKSLQNYENYGVLYNWEAAMAGEEYTSGIQGVCPSGWRLPSIEDWNELIEFVVDQGHTNEMPVDFWNSNAAGNALKSCWQVDSPLGPNCERNEHPRWNADSINIGLDKFGFAALPGGARRYDGYFGGLGIEGTWWSSSELPASTGLVTVLSIGRDGGIATSWATNERNGHSIRCVKD